jgi:hypothetical protein
MVIAGKDNGLWLLAALSRFILSIAQQQGRTDLWPKFLPEHSKKKWQIMLSKATLIHMGPICGFDVKTNVDMEKV